MKLISGIEHFPRPEQTNHEGLAGISPGLSAEMMISGYQKGFFPWFEIDDAFYWYSPPIRMIFDLQKDMQFSKSLERTIRKETFTVKINQNFVKVLNHCSIVERKGQDCTWLTNRFKEVFYNLHLRGIAHSVETYKNGKLVGGIFGLSIGSFFSGESMFHLETDASKVALAHLAYFLKKHHYHYIDCQLPSNHLQSLGGQSLSRNKYLAKLKFAASNMPESVIWPKHAMNETAPF